MPAPSARLIPVIVAVALLSLACGGEDGDQPEQAADIQPATSTTQGEPDDTDSAAPAEAEDQPTTEADATPEVEQEEEADPISEPEQEQTDQPASTSTTTTAVTTTTVPEPERLGDRFEWCSTIQAHWDQLDRTAAARDALALELQAAEDAVAAATDELDAVEAKDIRDEAQRSYERVVEAYEEAQEELFDYALTTRLLLAFPDVSPLVLAWIEGIITEDEQFDADITLGRTVDVEGNVAKRMEKLGQRLEYLASIVGYEDLTESELVAASRAWDAYDSAAGDTSALDSYESGSVGQVVVHAYRNSHRRYADTSLEEVRPANQIKFPAQAEAQLDEDKAAVISQFLTNHPARHAYQDSYRESCTPTPT